MSDNFKKLTGKNRNEYETAAKHLVDDCDVELFKELVDNDDFLFDFVKNNVTQRISNAINETNYQNLLEFLKYYSQSYEDTIVSALVKYADEAIECMKRAIMFDVNNAEYYAKMSDIYKAKEDFKTALDYIKEAESISENTEYKLKYKELAALNRKIK